MADYDVYKSKEYKEAAASQLPKRKGLPTGYDVLPPKKAKKK